MILLSNNERANSSPSLYCPIPHNSHHRESYSSTCLSLQRFIQRWLVTLVTHMILNASHSSEKKDCGSALCVSTSVGRGSRGRQYTSQGHREGHKIMSPTRNWREKHEEVRAVECRGECLTETDSEETDSWADIRMASVPRTVMKKAINYRSREIGKKERGLKQNHIWHVEGPNQSARRIRKKLRLMRRKPTSDTTNHMVIPWTNAVYPQWNKRPLIGDEQEETWVCMAFGVAQ